MSKRHSRSGFRDGLIEMLEQRRLLGAAVQAAPITGTLVGIVTKDVNHNSFGSYGDYDHGMAGVTVFIDANGNGRLDGASGSEPAELHVLSDSSGVFGFDDLPAGTYRVREIAPKGFQPLSPVFVDAVVIPGIPTISYAYQTEFQNTDYALIDGTEHSDQIRVAKDPNGLRVTINGRPPRIIKHVAGVVVRSGWGYDRVVIDPQVLLPTCIDGGGNADTLNGGGGKCLIVGGRGDDFINGGAAQDSIDGREGNDVITGGAGSDAIRGGRGNDAINGGDGSDLIGGDDGNNAINGGPGDDTITASSGNDSMSGGDGNDSIYGGGYGVDVLRGGIGDDKLDIFGDIAILVLDGGPGIDEVTSWSDRLPLNTKSIEHFVPNAAPHFPGAPDPNCFLTTAVVAWAGMADDCRELTLLRRFRDTYMRGLPEGPDMIRDYYTHAPRVVHAIENNGLSALEWPCVLAMVQAAIRHIRAGRNSKALAVYAGEYLRLKRRYVL